MSKNLSAIQTISKVCNVLCKIVFVFSIVITVLSAIGIVSLAVGEDSVLKIGGVNIRGFVEQNAEISKNEMYAEMIKGVAMGLCYTVLSRIAGNYFSNELKAGTPFTNEGAKEMLRLGILTACLPVAVSIAYAIVCSILEKTMGEINAPDGFGFDSITAGVMLIIMSVIFRYGTELASKSSAGEISENTEKEQE